jgi:2-polyprenyl-3-methyl-5-hydroxy-6-metoxy-1,4-benzoquinol methylase
LSPRTADCAVATEPILSGISRRRKLALLLRHVLPSSRILEVGSGDGWMSTRMRAHGHRVTALDISAPLADVHGDVLQWQTLGLDACAYDMVVALELIEHVDCLDALRALSKPHGLIFLSSPHPRWDWAMKLLEAAGLNQRRTSAHSNLTDFLEIPLERVALSRPAWVHQVGMFRNAAR